MTANEQVEYLMEIITMPFTYIVSPEKRIYFFYLITSLLLAWFVYRKKARKDSFLGFVFNKKVWLGKSPLVDYIFIFFNSLVKVLIIAPILVYALYSVEQVNLYLINTFGESTLNWSATQIAIVYTVVLIVSNDFGAFFVHYLMHKVPFLWQFHKIHHSATVLNPLTQYRIHPVELIVNNLRIAFIKISITGVFMYLGNGKVSLFTFLGINVFNFLFLSFGANLRHSHVKLKYFDFLEYLFISPYQHQIHHSNKKELYDTNMGARLAIWDYLAGTLVRSKSVDKLDFGLGEEEDGKYDTFWKNLMSPFKNLLGLNKNK